MASSTSRYVFTDEEVSQLANCTDQAELLHKFLRILNTKSIDPSAVYNAKKILGTSSDYGASILPKFFETIYIIRLPAGREEGQMPVYKSQL